MNSAQQRVGRHAHIGLIENSRGTMSAAISLSVFDKAIHQGICLGLERSVKSLSLVEDKEKCRSDSIPK